MPSLLRRFSVNLVQEIAVCEVVLVCICSQQEVHHGLAGSWQVWLP